MNTPVSEKDDLPALNHCLEYGPDGKPRGKDPMTLTDEEVKYIGFYRQKVSSLAEIACEKCLGHPRDTDELKAGVRACAEVYCEVWPYRLGNDPFRRWRMTPAQRRAEVERLAKARGVKLKPRPV